MSESKFILRIVLCHHFALSLRLGLSLTLTLRTLTLLCSVGLLVNRSQSRSLSSRCTGCFSMQASPQSGIRVIRYRRALPSQPTATASQGIISSSWGAGKAMLWMSTLTNAKNPTTSPRFSVSTLSFSLPFTNLSGVATLTPNSLSSFVSLPATVVWPVETCREIVARFNKAGRPSKAIVIAKRKLVVRVVNPVANESARQMTRVLLQHLEPPSRQRPSNISSLYLPPAL